MKIKILKIITHGIKNIKDDIELDFTNKTFDKIDINESNIKVIFGGNGAGKSAIINSIDIYKGISLKNNFLVQYQYSTYFKEMLNKEIKQFYIKVYFIVEDNFNEDNFIYSHKLLISLNDNLEIKEEEFSTIIGQSINSSLEKNLYKVKEGKLIINDDKDFDYYREKTYNLLKTSTFTSLFLSNNIIKYNNDLLKLNNKTNVNKFILHMYRLSIFLNSINVKMENDELNIKYNKEEKVNFIYLKDQINKFNITVSDEEDYIHKDDINEYNRIIDKLTSFIKLFKKNLVSIDVEKKIDGDYFHCFKSFNYGDYKIESIYESSGIKKLIELFSFVDLSIRGDIVFIDELDANIGSVFLNKLLEFVKEYGYGQLCFTSHNFEVMDILKNSNKSIEFLGETGKIVSWIKNGNYNPKSQYKNGMIDDSPFNIESYDFLKVFGHDI